MTERLFGLANLVASERAVLATTAAEAAGLLQHFPGLVDVMLKLPNFQGPLPDAQTDAGLLAFFASSHYLQVPHTAWAIFDLCKRGYYLEATILLRSLLEVLVQLRYFERHPHQLTRHLVPGRGISFLDMFEDLAPGYYRPFYGNLLSSFAHGKTGPLYFRFDRSDPAEHHIRVGCEYHPDHITLVVNQLIPVVFGFIRLFPILFPAHTLALEPVIERNRQEALAWLECAMKSHLAKNPDSASWSVLIGKIVSA